MAPLGPWPEKGDPAPIGVAVSGGADSMALALLAMRWAASRGLRVLALVVDHGLRPGSAEEACAAIARLGARGIEARLLVLSALLAGPSIAERARIARYDALVSACREIGMVDLLLGHHAGDQAETVLMRRRAASGADGLAGMADLVETADVRLLRPLLTIPPGRLRASLIAAGMQWVEDPSNRDRRAQRTRLRQELAAAGAGFATALLAEAAVAGAQRTIRRHGDANALARSAALFSEGYALLPPSLLPASAMAGLIRTIGGAPYRPDAEAVDRLVLAPKAMTLGGTRLMPAGRLGPGWMLLREAGAIGDDRPAVDGALWDGRFRLTGGGEAGGTVTALGNRRPGRKPALPAAILATLPAIERDGRLLAVPHLGWAADPASAGWRFRFTPAAPATESALFIDR